ncbi:toll/interleukin-1 receptor domain-containing protein [Nocardioides sp.]|uniref:toll/interleukin-1 receptor domain-containing protein n=1 Tax=Nocardioides sp. TaxID=35761 RepID=UPI0035185615
MALSRAERFKLKSRMLAEIDDQASGWDTRRQNLLLQEFGLPTLAMSWSHGEPEFEDQIANLPDTDLLDMYGIVLGLDEQEVQNSVDEPDTGNWKPGYVRLFLSHSAHHKDFIGRVADELAVTGIHGFVAHDTMEVSKPWQQQIEQALRSMQAFVAVIHPEFNDSAWCHQEVGWALGSRVPKFVVRAGMDPKGFIGSDQWPSVHGLNPRKVADEISSWVATVPALGERMVDGLFKALESANNYVDAGATAARIAALDSLSVDQWNRLDDIYRANDQIHGGALPKKALRPFYQEHGRTWPPPPKSPMPASSPVSDPWSSPAGPDPWSIEPVDEPPF